MMTATFTNPQGLRLTFTFLDFHGPLYAYEVPDLEKEVNDHPDHKAYGPWTYHHS